MFPACASLDLAGGVGVGGVEGEERATLCPRLMSRSRHLAHQQPQRVGATTG